MIRAAVTIAAMWTAALLIMHAAPAHASPKQRGLTDDMVRTMLESQHVCITTPCPALDMIDRSQGARGWHSFRLDALTIRARGNHFIIEGFTTQLN